MPRLLPLTALFLLVALFLAACDQTASNTAPPIPSNLTADQTAFVQSARDRLAKLKADLPRVQTALHKESALGPLADELDKAFAATESAVDHLVSTDAKTTWDQKKSAADAALKSFSGQLEAAEKKTKMPSGLDAPMM